MSIKIISTAALMALALTAGAVPITTAFTYQGRLNRNNGAANGTFDLRFELYNAATGGTRIGQPLDVLAQQISGGLFTVELNFGGAVVFDGTAYWLATSARPANTGTYAPTAGRVAIRPTPYAIHALSAAGVRDGSVTTTSLANGAVTASKLAPAAITQTQLNTAAAPANGQVLAFNGTGLSWATPQNGPGSPFLLNGTNAYYNGGNVGIGVATPTAKLDVRGFLTLETGGDAAIYTGTGNTEHNRFLRLLNSTVLGSGSGLKAGGILVADDYNFGHPGKNDLIIKGSVGVGTSSPANKVTVQTAGSSYGFEHTNGTVRLGTFTGGDSITAGWLGTISNHPLSFFVNNQSSSMTIATDGNVGIGTTAPAARLEINGSWDTTGMPHVRLTGNKPTIEWASDDIVPLLGIKVSWIAHASPLGGLEFWYRLINEFGPGPWNKVDTFGGAGYDGTLTRLDTSDMSFAATVRSADLLLGHSSRRGTPGRALVDLGTKLILNFDSDWSETVIGGNVAEVKTLRITGGADLAEPFAMSHDDGLEPGTVVVIDEKNPGKLRRSANAYDKKVAGIVSGANGVKPGISMIQEDALEAGENVSLSGRVYVKADASAGGIEPGDLLTTSSTPGRAMKAANHDKAQGAILGKAMTSLPEGDGMVLVLVTLQ